MTLSINQKKFLFFWIIFNTIGYLSYLTDWHPSITNTLTGSEIIIDEKYYFITPDYINCTLCSKSYSPKAHFYPFHSFTYKTYWGSHVFDGFIGLWGYYDHEEYVVYVIVPLIILLIIYLYRRYFPSTMKTNSYSSSFNPKTNANTDKIEFYYSKFKYTNDTEFKDIQIAKVDVYLDKFILTIYPYTMFSGIYKIINSKKVKTGVLNTVIKIDNDSSTLNQFYIHVSEFGDILKVFNETRSGIILKS